jgi:hypothetical protein
MTAATIASTETFVREPYAHPIEAGLPLAPTFKAVLDTLLVETAKSMGQNEVRAAGVSEPGAKAKNGTTCCQARRQAWPIAG